MGYKASTVNNYHAGGVAGKWWEEGQGNFDGNDHKGIFQFMVESGLETWSE